jgi:hypothetical protein
MAVRLIIAVTDAIGSSIFGPNRIWPRSIFWSPSPRGVHESEPGELFLSSFKRLGNLIAGGGVFA